MEKPMVFDLSLLHDQRTTLVLWFLIRAVLTTLPLSILTCQPINVKWLRIRTVVKTKNDNATNHMQQKLVHPKFHTTPHPTKLRYFALLSTTTTIHVYPHYTTLHLTPLYYNQLHFTSLHATPLYSTHRHVSSRLVAPRSDTSIHYTCYWQSVISS